tara:strand:- start:1183 stop:1359 length:177 start_codon:yes stop_codon:yes gene_type:complete
MENNKVDHLKEYVKGWIEFQKEEYDCKDMSEEDIFDCVMENIVSMVADYRYCDYNKES